MERNINSLVSTNKKILYYINSCFVCRGNWVGQKPYRLGQPCSDCPSGFTTCRNELCAGELINIIIIICKKSVSLKNQIIIIISFNYSTSFTQSIFYTLYSTFCTLLYHDPVSSCSCTSWSNWECNAACGPGQNTRSRSCSPQSSCTGQETAQTGSACSGTTCCKIQLQYSYQRVLHSASVFALYTINNVGIIMVVSI